MLIALLQMPPRDYSNPANHEQPLGGLSPVAGAASRAGVWRETEGLARNRMNTLPSLLAQTWANR